MASTQGPGDGLRVERGRHGLRLRDAGLAFDAREPDCAAFLSHASLRWRGALGRVITSDVTARLLGARGGALLGSPLGRPFALGSLTLELWPAAWGLGAASLLVQRGGARLLYTRAVGAGFPPGQETARAGPCDVLVLGEVRRVPRRLHPDGVAARLETLGQWVRGTAAAGAWPVVVCEPTGEAVPLVGQLVARGLVVRAHRRIRRAAAVLAETEPEVAQPLGFEGVLDAGQVLLWPRGEPLPADGRGAPVRGILVAADGEEPEARRGAGCETGVALGAQADRQGWIRFLEACAPGRVVLPAPPPAWLADAVVRLGAALTVLRQPAQLGLF